MIYDVLVTHTRRELIHRTFSHRAYMWLVDLDELPRLPWWVKPFARFESRDHLGSPAKSIRENLTEWLGERGISLGGGQILMLANARVLGYVFNPLSVYWCHDASGALVCVVAEVHNTYSLSEICARVKLADPSFRNWPALEYAVLENIVPDFPLCNKSFNLSYSGSDA